MSLINLQTQISFLSKLVSSPVTSDFEYASAVETLNKRDFLDALKNKLTDEIQSTLRSIVENVNWRRVFHINPNFELDDYYKNELKAKLTISLIIPVYNVQEYLTDCLQSVCDQTYPSIEVICVNDGSTDGSPEILEKFKSKMGTKLRIINKKNEGLGPARNTGIEASTGYYVYFLDSDDILAPNALQSVYDVISSQVDFVAHGIKVIAMDEQLEKEVLSNRAWIDSVRKESGVYQLGSSPKAELVSVAWNKLYKLSLLLCKKIHFPNLLHEDEVFFWGHIVHCSQYFYLDQDLYCYRRRQSSIMGTRLQSLRSLDAIKIHIEIYKLIKDHGLKEKYGCAIDQLFIHSILDFMSIVNSKYRSQALQLIYSYVWEIRRDSRRLKDFYWTLINEQLPIYIKEF